MNKFKRLFSFLLVFLMLFLYAIPCFAETEKSQITVDSSYFNFDNFSGYGIDENSFIPATYDFINYYVNSDSTKIYFFPVLLYVESYSRYINSYIVVQSQKTLTVEFTQNFIKGYSDYFNVNIKSDSEFSTDIITIRNTNGWVQDTRSVARVISIPSNKYNMTNSVYDSSNYLLFDNGKCVSEKFCSDSAKGLEDYEEGNVHISGLTGFFNNILNKFTEQIESIKNIPSLILNGLKELFIPDAEKMKQIFSDFTNEFSEIFGYGPLIDTLKSVVNPETVSVVSPDVSEKFSYSLGNTSVDVDFSLPVSNFYTDDVKSKVSDYLKGIFYILLLFYNLSEIYFLIRGTRPWKDPSVVTELNAMQEEKAERHARRRNK